MKQLAIALTCLLAATSAAAHEIGTTEVRLTIHANGTWSASITTGPQSLLNKLEAEARLPLSRNLDQETLRRALEAARDTLAQQIDLRFDGARSAVAVTIVSLDVPVDVTRPSFVVISAAGMVPSGAKTVTWQYRLAYSTYAVVCVVAGQPVTTIWIDGDDTGSPLQLVGVAAPTHLAIVRQYLTLGFLHIVPAGLDHVLFVLGIFLLTTSARPILIQVTAFTLAHSLTLGLTMYGVVSLTPRIVEPLIAASIAYVAIENIATARLTVWRPAVVFAFGLLHGMGFAGVLKDLQLPRGEFVPALVSFNAGIELAQLTVIGAAFLSVAVWCRHKPWYRTRVVVPASLIIAVTGVVWTVQRAAMR